MATGHAFRPKGASTWRARWDLSADPATGLRRRRSKGGFRTKREAEAYAAAQTATVARGVSVDPGKLTLGDYLKVWLAGCRPELGPSTWNWYRPKVQHYIVPALGARKLRDLTREELRVFYASLPSNMVDRVHRTLRRALYEAVASDLLPRNPAANMRRGQPWSAHGRGMRVWVAGELQAFLCAVHGQPWTAIFRLMATTGCRRGEALGLFWSDVDLESGVVSFQRGLADPGPALQDTKTKASRRSVEIDEATVSALRVWHRLQVEARLAAGDAWLGTVELASGEHVTNDLVFTRPNGRWVLPAKTTAAFYRFSAAAGLPRLRLHDLRHTHATLLLKAGVNAKVGIGAIQLS